MSAIWVIFVLHEISQSRCAMTCGRLWAFNSQVKLYEENLFEKHKYRPLTCKVQLQGASVPFSLFSPVSPFSPFSP